MKRKKKVFLMKVDMFIKTSEVLMTIIIVFQLIAYLILIYYYFLDMN
jgi:hypothetical protein